jgi:hypothetical protein
MLHPTCTTTSAANIFVSVLVVSAILVNYNLCIVSVDQQIHLLDRITCRIKPQVSKPCQNSLLLIMGDKIFPTFVTDPPKHCSTQRFLAHLPGDAATNHVWRNVLQNPIVSDAGFLDNSISNHTTLAQCLCNLGVDVRNGGISVDFLNAT